MGDRVKKDSVLRDFSRNTILSFLAALAPFTLANKVKANIAPFEYTDDTWSQYVHNEEQYKPQNRDLESDLLGSTKDLQNYIANVRHNNSHYEHIDNILNRHLKPNLLAVMKNPLIPNPPTNYYFGEGDWIDSLMVCLLDRDIYDFLEKTKYNLLGGFGNPWERRYKARGDLDRDGIELAGLYTGFIFRPPYLDDETDASKWIESRMKWLDQGRYYWLDKMEYKFLGWDDFPFGFMDHSAIPEPSTFALFGLGALAIFTFRKRKQEN